MSNMRAASLLLVLFLIGLLSSCDRSDSPGNDDAPPIIEFFLLFEDSTTGTNTLVSEHYNPDDFSQEYLENGKIVSERFNILHSYQSGELIVGPIVIAPLSSGLGERGTFQDDGPFTLTSRLFFRENDIDTIHSVVYCHETCYFQDKRMELYFNDELIWDFDFSGKDSLLIEQLLENNVWPYKDTVVFTIHKPSN